MPDDAAHRVLARMQRDLLARALRDEVGAGGGLLLAHNDDAWFWQRMEDPHPDDHRLAHLAREAAAAVHQAGPLTAAGALAIVRDAPDPHATICAWIVHRSGERAAFSVLALPTADGIVVPGPARPMHPLGPVVHDAVAAALRA